MLLMTAGTILHLELCVLIDIFVSLYIIDIQTSANMKEDIIVTGSYKSPEIVMETIEIEGLLCLSGNHESLTEDDSWGELLED